MLHFVIATVHEAWWHAQASAIDIGMQAWAVLLWC